MSGTDRPRAGERRDEGFALPFTLIAILIMALVVSSLALYTTSSLSYARHAEKRIDGMASTDGVMRIALEKLRTGASQCTKDKTTVLSSILNDQTVTVTCVMQERRMYEVGDFALVITANGIPSNEPALENNGDLNSDRAIQGNVYVRVPPASLRRKFSIVGGDFWYPPVDNVCTPPNYSNLRFYPAGERGYTCDSTPWTTVAPAPTLAAAPVTVRGTTGTTDSNGCTIWQPGVYNSPPVFSKGSENFFQPGTYVFNFSGQIRVKSTTIIGGTPGTSAVAKTKKTMKQKRCVSAMAAAEQNAGVTWVLGGGANIYVDSNGAIELFTPPSTPTYKGTSIVAYTDATNGYPASTVTGVATPIITLKAGDRNGAAIHGQVYVPNGYILFEKMAKKANAEFMGSVVAAKLDLQAKGRRGNFNIATPVTPVSKIYYLEAISGTQNLKVSARIDATNQTVQLSSWVVS